MRKAINIEDAVTPAGQYSHAVTPAGQYSHAVIANGFVFVSGQGPADPARNVADEEAD